MFDYLTNTLCATGLNKDILKVLNHDDMSEIVLKCLDMMDKLSIHKEFKCEQRSNLLRKYGNETFMQKMYSNALKLYNQALAKAPVYSRAMKLAYSNRSALLHKTKRFDAALKDIEKCFSLGCPDDIAEKLRERKLDCLNRLQKKNEEVDQFIETFFRFNVERNPDIPCASSMLEVSTDEPFPKVVAATDVQTGTVLALEPSFVSAIDEKFTYVSCYYCQKASLNLEPCLRCSYALFCSEECRVKCSKDYHSVECELTPIFQKFFENNNYAVFIKIVIKIKNKFDTWEEFIMATNDVGMGEERICERIKKSSINELYDVKNKYSPILWYKEIRELVNVGVIYNSAISLAPVLNDVIRNSTFFPKKETLRLRAVRAVSRLLMYFAVCNPNILEQQVPGDELLLLNNRPGIVSGYYPLACKLTRSCKPNVSLVQLNGKIAFVATRPIKKGTELTYCSLPWMQSCRSIKRVFHHYRVMRILCKCQVCLENWNVTTVPMVLSSLSEKQRRFLDTMNIQKICDNLERGVAIKSTFQIICEGLSVFEDMPFCKAYVEIYSLFKYLTELLRKVQ